MGEFTCSSCDPEFKVKADGAWHPVTGQPYADTAMVKIISPTSVEWAMKQNGKETLRGTATVSADGSAYNYKVTNHFGEKPSTEEGTDKRISKGPVGSHAISGSWLQDKVINANEAMRTVHYEMTADGFKMSQNGQSYDAKFDGKEYPITGDPGHTSVTLRKIDANTVEEIDHRRGKVVDEIRLAAAKDGKTVEVTDKYVPGDQTTTYTLEKQP